MIGRPQESEAAPHYFKYIDLASGDDPIPVMARQLEESIVLLSSIAEDKSLHRYAPDKWSIRQSLNHVTDTERAFAYRALWFSRGFDAPLIGYDQEIAAAGAEADRISWAEHVEEFRRVRLSTIPLFQNLPAAAWMKRGVVSGNLITVRALAYIIPGHVSHHIAVLQQRYL
jgi:DinB superfamily